MLTPSDLLNSTIFKSIYIICCIIILLLFISTLLFFRIQITFSTEGVGVTKFEITLMFLSLLTAFSIVPLRRRNPPVSIRLIYLLVFVANFAFCAFVLFSVCPNYLHISGRLSIFSICFISFFSWAAINTLLLLIHLPTVAVLFARWRQARSLADQKRETERW